jgi:hypothetical protein
MAKCMMAVKGQPIRFAGTCSNSFFLFGAVISLRLCFRYTRRSLPLVRFETASVGIGNYVVVVLHVGNLNASDMKFASQREPPVNRYSLIHFLSVNSCLMRSMSTLPFVNCSKTCLTITVDDITILSGRAIPVALPDSETQHLYVYIVYLPAPCVTTKLRKSTKIEQAVFLSQMFNVTVLTLYFLPQLRWMD